MRESLVDDGKNLSRNTEKGIYGELQGAGEKDVMERAQRILNAKGRRVLEEVKTSILKERIECREIRDALAHLMSYWHDVTRPALISLACEAVGGDPVVTVPAAKALIMISGAVDVHDDIIDRSGVKLGPTVFGKFGKDVALLAGDALLFKGLVTLYEMREMGIPTERIGAVLDTIKRLFFELGDAEALELRLRRSLAVKPARYIEIIRKKAADVEGYTRIGSMLGGGSDAQIEALGEYGRLLGMLVILKDEMGDTLDLKAELPRRMRHEVLPLPIVYAAEEPKLRASVAAMLRRSRITEEDARSILKTTYEAGGFRRTVELMWSLGRSAIRCLDSILKIRELTLLIKATLPPAHATFRRTLEPNSDGRVSDEFRK